MFLKKKVFSMMFPSSIIILVFSFSVGNSEKRKDQDTYLRDSNCNYFRNIGGSARFQDKCEGRTAANMAKLVTSEGSCFTNMNGKSMLNFHLWTKCVHGPKNCWDKKFVQHQLLLYKAFLVTQDLNFSHLTHWMPPFEYDMYLKSDSVEEVHSMAPFIVMRPFYYETEIIDTPLYNSDYFRNLSSLYQVPGFYVGTESDIIRMVILHNYGGVWLDEDAIPLTDLYNITAGVNLQFIPGFTVGQNSYNNHIMHVLKKSKLARRKLEIMLMLPFNAPNAWPPHIQKGFVAGGGNIPNSWIYNAGLPMQTYKIQLERYNRSDSGEFDVNILDEIEFCYPMGWFDPYWNCFAEDKTYVNKTQKSYTAVCSGAFIWHRLSKYHAMEKDNPGMKELVHLIFSLHKNFTMAPMNLANYINCSNYL